MGSNKKSRKFLNQLDLDQIPEKYKKVFAELQQGNTEPMETECPDMFFAYFGMAPVQKRKAFSLTGEILQQQIREADEEYQYNEYPTQVRKPDEVAVYLKDNERMDVIIKATKDASVLDENKYLIYSNKLKNKKKIIGVCSIISKSDILSIVAPENILANEEKCFRIKMNFLAQFFHLNNIQEFTRKKILPLCEQLAIKHIYEVYCLAKELNITIYPTINNHSLNP